jgi:putative peptidoglycan lipid II flippase
MSKERTRFAAAAVSAGILLSRIAGLVRERVIAHYLGNSVAAGAFKAAIRIPGLLQNLFGEGVLSASFIPVYSRLRAEGREEDANLVARVVFTALLAVVAIAVAIGIFVAPLLVDLIAPGFEGEARALTIELVEIIFPGVGLLVLSAWCLGVLNSHRRFFLSYVAPVLWNAAQIAALVILGLQAAGEMSLARAVAWGTVAGSALQLLLQIPTTLRLLNGFGLSKRFQDPVVRQVFVSFLPVVMARGVVQISAFVDEALASYIGPETVAAIGFSQILYLLPISLFAMAISAAELPEMSSVIGETAEVHAKLRERIRAARIRMSFFVLPSAIAYFTIGDVIIAMLFQTGKFTASDTQIVWTILCGSTIGLAAATQARLLSSSFYALADTRTPLVFATVRVLVGGIIGWMVALPLRERFGWPPHLAAAGLTASAGTVAWLEFVLLSRALQRRIGRIDPSWSTEAKILFAGILAGAAGFAANRTLPIEQPIMKGTVVVGVFGAIYFGAGLLLGLDQVKSLLRRLKR